MNQQIKNKLVNEIAQMSHIMNNKISRHVGNQLCISVASGFHIHKTKTFPGVTIRPTETERHNNLSLFCFKQVYRRRYESCRSSMPKLH